MRRAKFVNGPIVGTEIDLCDPLPLKLSIHLTADWGGPGIAHYDLDPDGVFAQYVFMGWHNQEVRLNQESEA